MEPLGNCLHFPRLPGLNHRPRITPFSVLGLLAFACLSQALGMAAPAPAYASQRDQENNRLNNDIAPVGDANPTDTQENEESVAFLAFLQANGQTTLLARQRILQWQTSDDPVDHWKHAIEISLWLEQELKGRSWDQTQTDYPFLDSGSHTQTPAFAMVELVRLRAEFSQVAEQIPQIVFRPQQENQALIQQLASIATSLRSVESRIQQALQSRKKQTATSQTTSATDRLQGTEITAIARSTIAWCFYYRWLLSVDTETTLLQEELESGKQIFMQLLNVTQPDIAGATIFRWYDPNRAGSRSYLTGLGLILIALQQMDSANSGFATLQQSSRGVAGQDLILLQWQALIRLRQWERASDLAQAYLQNLAASEHELGARFVQTIANWATGRAAPIESVSEANTVSNEARLQNVAPEFSIRSPDMQTLLTRLLLRLCERGAIEQAAKLSTETNIDLPAGSMPRQVVALQQLLSRTPLSQLSDAERQDLVDRLQLVSMDEKNSTGIRRWASNLLGTVHIAQQNWDSAIAVWLPLWKPSTNQDVQMQQRIAWQIAEAYQQKASLDPLALSSAIQWYRQARDVQPNSPVAEAAQVRSQLLQLQNEPVAAIDYLLELPPNIASQDWVRKPLLLLLFEQWKTAPPGSPMRSSSATHLEQILGDALGISDLRFHVQWNQDQQNTALKNLNRSGQISSLDLGSRLSLAAIWLQVLEQQPALEADSQRAVIFNWALDLPSSQEADASSRSGPQWQSIVLQSLPFWDQQGATTHSITAADRLLETSLSDGQQFLVYTYWLRAAERQLHPRAPDDSRLRSDPDDLSALAQQALERYAALAALLQESPAVAPPETMQNVKLAWAQLLYARNSDIQAIEVLGDSATQSNNIAQRQLLARLLTRLDRRSAAAPHWNWIAGQVLEGDSDWFEAKYHIIQQQAQSDPAKAKSAYQALRRLYPVIPSPWNNKLEDLN